MFCFLDGATAVTSPFISTGRPPPLLVVVAAPVPPSPVDHHVHHHRDGQVQGDDDRHVHHHHDVPLPVAVVVGARPCHDVPRSVGDDHHHCGDHVHRHHRGSRVVRRRRAVSAVVRMIRVRFARQSIIEGEDPG